MMTTRGARETIRFAFFSAFALACEARAQGSSTSPTSTPAVASKWPVGSQLIVGLPWGSFLVLLICTTQAAVVGELRAPQSTGTVRSVTGEIALVAMEGDVMPPVGAKAEIYFKIPGSDEEISVPTGSALEIDQGDLQVKIENATGSVEKGQLVRFLGRAPGTSTPASSPAPNKSSPVTKRSVVGEWHQVFDETLVVFRADGTLETEDKEGVTTGKYRVDYKQTPNTIDLFEFTGPNAPPNGKDQVVRGIFAFEDNRIRLYLGEKEGQDRPTGIRPG